MNTITFVKWAAFGAALGALSDYILSRDDVKQLIAKKKAKNLKKLEYPKDCYEEQEEPPIIQEGTNNPPWEETHIEETKSAYTRLSEILDSEEYSYESEKPNYIQNIYSEKELEAIYETEAALAEEESPNEDEPTEEELAGYYNPDDDLYDAYDDYIPDEEDEGELVANDSVHEIDEDEFENSPYDTEVYYYYPDIDYFCDDEKNHMCGYREVEELFGSDTFVKLKSGQPVIFLRNDFLETSYKIIGIMGEYDE